MRKAHFLKPNANVERAHAAIWVDTETEQVPMGPLKVGHVLRFGWACYQRTRPGGAWTEPEWFRFDTRAQFWDWALSKVRERTRTYMFAHNWAFDAPVLGTFSILPERGWRLTRAVIESPPVILRWSADRATLLMLDTLNWWRLPLKKIGESIGLEKLPMPDLGASKESWDRYARRDVEVIQAAVQRWWGFLIDQELGGFAPTLASQALRAFRHKYLRAKILLDDNETALAIARESLHGGRVEAYRLGRVEGPIHHFDVNSMYPFVMSEQEYPAVLALTATSPTFAEMERWLNEYAVVADLEIRTSEPRYAHVIDSRLCFPVGSFRTALTTPDLKHALASGHVTKIHAAAVYEKAPLFREYVRDLYALRLKWQAEGNTVNAGLVKLLLNSLYGKFAQRGEVWETTAETDEETIHQWLEVDFDTGDVVTKRQFSGIIQTKLREGECQTSHPAIAAHVTAYARAHLWRLVQLAGVSEVYYMDTDSLFCSASGAAKLLEQCDALRLGGLKPVDLYPWVLIHGAKDYATADKVVLKGIRGKAIQLDASSYEHDEWSGLAGLVATGSLDVPTTTRRIKHLSRFYSKGRAAPDGSVAPWVLGD